MGKRAIDTVIDWLERQQGSRGGSDKRKSKERERGTQECAGLASDFRPHRKPDGALAKPILCRTGP